MNATAKQTEEIQEIQWTKLLQDAVEKPGTIMKGYSLFWNYSFGNQLLALWQAYGRGIEPSPIGSYNKWKTLGRQVKRGEKAIMLCMPAFAKKTKKQDDGTEKEEKFMYFVYKKNWFFLSQTEGKEYQPERIPNWDRALALKTLEITEVPFTHINGNTQGYSHEKTIAINPLAQMPNKTTFHEVGHILLGHTERDHNYLDNKKIDEVEAESVALLCCEALGLEGAEFSRAYIQNYLGAGNTIPEKSAKKIFSAADKILKAGRAPKESEHE